MQEKSRLRLDILEIVIGEKDGDHAVDLVQPGYQIDLALDRIGLNNSYDLTVGEHAVHLDAIESADPHGNLRTRSA
jgi:hypothetical protein